MIDQRPTDEAAANAAPNEVVSDIWGLTTAIPEMKVDHGAHCYFRIFYPKQNMHFLILPSSPVFLDIHKDTKQSDFLKCYDYFLKLFNCFTFISTWMEFGALFGHSMALSHFIKRRHLAQFFKKHAVVKIFQRGPGWPCFVSAALKK